MTNKYVGVLVVIAAVCCFSQVEKAPRFEVVSIKRVGEGVPLGFSGGPGSADPGRVSYSRVTMLTLIRGAFGVKRDQILGPSWIESESYAITATLSPTTTISEYHQMVATLLRERFGLAFHRQAKEDRGYALSVAKGGPKMDVSTARSAGVISVQTGLSTRPRQEQDAGGFPVLDAGAIWGSSVRDGVVRVTFRECSMGALANMLSRLIGQRSGPIPVVDRTGLSGKYDFRIEYAESIHSKPAPSFQPGQNAAADVSGPEVEIFAAIQKQLGLRLVETKLTRDYIAIDHLERVPTEN